MNVRNKITILTATLTALLGALTGVPVYAQEPIDSSVQASPLKPPVKAPVEDGAVESSPLPGRPAIRSGQLRPMTVIPLKLSEALDSGSLRNGQSVAATLTSTVPVAGGSPLRAGTPVSLTVVETLAAGKIASPGEISLQVQRVGPFPVYTDIQTFRGQPGHKDVADSAPQKGTDARLAAGMSLNFHIQPEPQPANGPPPNKPHEPGDVNGVANGTVQPR